MLFKQSSWFGFKFFLLIVLSVILMTLDYHGLYTKQLRMSVSAIVAPIQYAVSWPVEMFDWVTDNIAKQQVLIEENATLKANAIMLQGRLQQILALQKENSQLRALLQATAKRKEEFTISQMLAVTTKPHMARLVIDKGSKDHVYQGQPVVDARGVMGQIIQVGSLTSQVMLITDVNSAIPVQIYRNGLRAIAIGTGTSHEITLLNVSNQADVRNGDVIITSGLGLRYPEGYPVGIVTEVKHKRGSHFAEIIVKPSARLLQSRQVLLVWHKGSHPLDTLQEEIDSEQKSMINKKVA